MLQSSLGIAAFVAIAWMVSENRARFPWKLVIAGISLQVVLGFLLLKIHLFNEAIRGLNGLVIAIQESTEAGTSMVFGYLGGGPLPFEELFPGAAYILAFKSLPVILVLSALSSLLFYWRILPLVIGLFSKLFEKTLRIGGAEGLGLSANIFVGMIEAPLLIRPYLRSMSRSELFSVMCCGMATVAGTVLVLYASVLTGVLPDALSHIIVASVMSVPASLVIARIMVPDTQAGMTEGRLDFNPGVSGAFEAIAEGTTQGVKLLVYVISMMVVMVALVRLVDLCLGIVPAPEGHSITLQQIFGYCFAPVAWLMGIPWSESAAAGSLLGTKTIVNEFVAYLELANLPADTLSATSAIVITYALCGFANPGSLGIMIGGLSTMAPERKSEIIQLSIKSIFAGTLATCMTGAMVNLILLG
ncbi:MAG: nucleoside:proton symporter [Gammaproteobacteria bacterium]|nr:nucleoside:proton symporter [Gammaproteobacteria bacterium]